MARRGRRRGSEEETAAVFREGDGGVIVDDVAGMEAGGGGGDDDCGFGFGGLPEIEVVGRPLCVVVGRGVADEGEFAGFFVPGEMLIAGFAGDEFVRGFRVCRGCGEDEDAVGFGFCGDDGVGERLAVFAELVVEDVGELTGGLAGEFDEGEGGAELGGFAGCWSCLCGLGFGFRGVFGGGGCGWGGGEF